jgi:hypothetical protein
LPSLHDCAFAIIDDGSLLCRDDGAFDHRAHHLLYRA